jgi:hypothetical protein
MDTMLLFERLFDFKHAVSLWNDIKQNNTDTLKAIKEEFSYYANFNQDQRRRDGFIKEFSEEKYLQ